MRFHVTLFEPHQVGPLVAETHERTTEQKAFAEVRYWILFGEGRTATVVDRTTGQITDVDADLNAKVRKQEVQGALF